MTVLDARGLSCPEPVILLSKAMSKKESAYQIIVDNQAARENTTRYAMSQGYHTSVSEKNGEYTLSISK